MGWTSDVLDVSIDDESGSRGDCQTACVMLLQSRWIMFWYGRDQWKLHMPATNATYSCMYDDLCRAVVAE